MYLRVGDALTYDKKSRAYFLELEVMVNWDSEILRFRGCWACEQCGEGKKKVGV